MKKNDEVAGSISKLHVKATNQDFAQWNFQSEVLGFENANFVTSL